MDYLYSKVEQASFNETTPERAAFSQHLTRVAKALHDIEWVDSGDYGPGDENEAIMACLEQQNGAVIESACAKVIHAIEQLKGALEKYAA